MAKILSFDNKLMKIGNGLLGPAEPVPTRSYKVKFKGDSSSLGSITISNMSPGATAGYYKSMDSGLHEIEGALSSEQLNNLNSNTGVSVNIGYNGVYYLSLTFDGINSNILNFIYDCGLGTEYTVYEIINGIETEIRSGTLGGTGYSGATDGSITIPVNKYNITYSTVSNGTFTGPSNAYEYSTVTVTNTPDSGYDLDYITVDGTQIQGNTFTMPTHDVTISGAFVTDIPDYRLAFTGNNFTISNLNPNATSGYRQFLGTQALDVTNANNSTGLALELYSGYATDSFIFTDITANTLSFKHNSTGGTNYTLYKTMSGVESMISSGTLPTVSQMTEYTINLT